MPAPSSDDRNDDPLAAPDRTQRHVAGRRLARGSARGRRLRCHDRPRCAGRAAAARTARPRWSCRPRSSSPSTVNATACQARRRSPAPAAAAGGSCATAASGAPPCGAVQVRHQPVDVRPRSRQRPRQRRRRSGELRRDAGQPVLGHREFAHDIGQRVDPRRHRPAGTATCRPPAPAGQQRPTGRLARHGGDLDLVGDEAEHLPQLRRGRGAERVDHQIAGERIERRPAMARGPRSPPRPGQAPPAARPAGRRRGKSNPPPARNAAPSTLRTRHRPHGAPAAAPATAVRAPPLCRGSASRFRPAPAARAATTPSAALCAAASNGSCPVWPITSSQASVAPIHPSRLSITMRPARTRPSRTAPSKSSAACSACPIGPNANSPAEPFSVCTARKARSMRAASSGVALQRHQVVAGLLHQLPALHQKFLEQILHHASGR